MDSLKNLADDIAARFARLWPQYSAGLDWDFMRDHCDLQTSGDLDTVKLDILTDMVQARIHHAWRKFA